MKTPGRTFVDSVQGRDPDTAAAEDLLYRQRDTVDELREPRHPDEPHEVGGAEYLDDFDDVDDGLYSTVDTAPQTKGNH